MVGLGLLGDLRLFKVLYRCFCLSLNALKPWRGLFVVFVSGSKGARRLFILCFDLELARLRTRL